MNLLQTQRALAAAQETATTAAALLAGAQQLARLLGQAGYYEAALEAQPLLTNLTAARDAATAAAQRALEAYRVARLGPPTGDAVRQQEQVLARMQGFGERYHGAGVAKAA